MTHFPIGFTRRAMLVALTVVPFAAVAADQTPEQVVRDLIDAMQAGDAARIRAVFAEDASQAYGSGMPRTGDAFRNWLESDIIEPSGRVENPQIDTDGNRVVITGRYRNDNGYSSEADFLMSVAGGKITSWQMRY